MSRPHSLTLKEQNMDTDYVFFLILALKKVRWQAESSVCSHLSIGYWRSFRIVHLWFTKWHLLCEMHSGPMKSQFSVFYSLLHSYLSNLSWINEIKELLHDILIYWDAPVNIHIYTQAHAHTHICIYIYIYIFIYFHFFLGGGGGFYTTPVNNLIEETLT